MSEKNGDKSIKVDIIDGGRESARIAREIVEEFRSSQQKGRRPTAVQLTAEKFEALASEFEVLRAIAGEDMSEAKMPATQRLEVALVGLRRGLGDLESVILSLIQSHNLIYRAVVRAGILDQQGRAGLGTLVHRAIGALVQAGMLDESAYSAEKDGNG